MGKCDKPIGFFIIKDMKLWSQLGTKLWGHVRDYYDQESEEKRIFGAQIIEMSKNDMNSKRRVGRWNNLYIRAILVKCIFLQLYNTLKKRSKLYNMINKKVKLINFPLY